PTHQPTPTAVTLPRPTATVLPTPTPMATLTPTPTTVERLARSIPPERDIHDLARRLKPEAIASFVQRSTSFPPRRLGQQEVFWVADLTQNRVFSTTATLVNITDHTYAYVESGLTVDQAALARSLDRFERITLPIIQSQIGPVPDRDADGDPRIAILHARLPGAAGYFSSADNSPHAFQPFSNERLLIAVDPQSVPPDTRAYDGTLAHELTHLVHWAAKKNEEVWVAEGLAEVGSRIAGWGTSGAGEIFQRNPDTQLTAWGPDPQSSSAHYGAAYLFLSYFLERFGGEGALRKLISQRDKGLAGFQDYLEAIGQSERIENVFADWVVANYLDDPRLDDGRYGYRDLDVHVRAVQPALPGRSISGQVSQYAASYWQIDVPEGAQLIFTGTTEVKLLPNEPKSGRFEWWSQRGDGIDSRLTRSFDLSQLSHVTLTFWTWYDIEADYDYAYVEVSMDGGGTWSILPGRFTTAANPTGSSLGSGYTGRSGGGGEPQWVHEEIDLSPYTGRQILLRFEYVTDEAYNAPSFALDDIAIPELGFFDDVEGDREWTAEGFVRSDNWVPQRFIVQLIQLEPTGSVKRLDIDPQQRGAFPIDGLAVLVVAATAPATTEPAAFQFSVQPVSR
ncbi:MAG: immune inhibitor A, partial [Chloroflexi bacterium]|nr:immune inhibitor A [Chloroflexota bacterium]